MFSKLRSILGPWVKLTTFQIHNDINNNINNYYLIITNINLIIINTN